MSVALDYVRQQDWYDPRDHDHLVTMIGLGGIGSFAAETMARLGVGRMRLCDPDEVETHNIPNQNYTLEAVGSRKVDATLIHLRQLRGDDIHVTAYGDTYQEAIAAGWRTSGTTISGLDSMEQRSDIWPLLKYKPGHDLYIDARIGGQLIAVHVLDPNDVSHAKKYEESLHSDDAADPAPCTARGVIDVGYVTASIITQSFRRIVSGDEDAYGVHIHNQATLDGMHIPWEHYIT